MEDAISTPPSLTKTADATDEREPVGRVNERGHARMRPRMTYSLVGVADSDQLPRSPGQVVYNHLYIMRTRKEGKSQLRR